MLFKNVQNLVDIVSNLRGTFDFCRPWPIKARAFRRWCVSDSRTKGRTRSTFFLLVSTFLPTRHDVLRNSTAAAVSCVLKFELIRGLCLIGCEVKLIHGIEE